MATGLEMLLKASGIDLEKITTDFTQLKDGVTKTLQSIDARLQRIEERQGEIWQKLQAQQSPQMPAQPQPEAPQPQAAPQTWPLLNQ